MFWKKNKSFWEGENHSLERIVTIKVEWNCRRRPPHVRKKKVFSFWDAFPHLYKRDRPSARRSVDLSHSSWISGQNVSIKDMKLCYLKDDPETSIWKQLARTHLKSELCQTCFIFFSSTISLHESGLTGSNYEVLWRVLVFLNVTIFFSFFLLSKPAAAHLPLRMGRFLLIMMSTLTKTK